MTRILVVDDDALMLKVFQTAFTFEGFEVITAGDGLLAFEKVTTFKPDIVLMDIMIPSMNGLEVLTKMSQLNELKNIPVIMLTNLTGPTICENAISKGAKLCLIKDQYKPKEVVAMVRQVLACNNHTSVLPQN
jgi:CheY-like chemotaxis protein